MIPVTDALQSTAIIAAILAAAVAVTLVVKRDKALFPLSVTQELKGFAILAIIFAHTGYYLVSDHRFLEPLSYLAGVGVDIFLFVSGIGLTMSALRKRQTIIQFYRARVSKLYIPMWLVLIALFLINGIWLHIGYSFQYILEAFAGVYPHANLYQDIDSPLWYFTLIISYYAVFPLVFNYKRPWLTALILFLAGLLVLRLDLPLLYNVSGLYEVHTAAFPLGVLAAWILNEPKLLGGVTWEKLNTFFTRNLSRRLLRVVALLFLVLVGEYFTVHSGVGKGWSTEENINLLILAAVVLVFVLKPWQSKLLTVVGVYSYEIYLLQWPLAYYYGAFIPGIPGWLGMLIYLGILAVCCWILRQITLILTKSTL